MRMSTIWVNLKGSSGFSYVEVLVASMLVAITLVPVLSALFGGTQGSSIHNELAVDHYRMTGRLEEVLAKPFDELQQAADAAGGPGVIVAVYSDSVGTERRRLVYLSRYDGDNVDADNDPFTGLDDGLIWVRIQIEDTLESMETLTKR
ncbi:MAG: hypothetical protein QNK29_10020 [Desulfobacterales bacterium]|nr:hypothetical protein [Desulfobacterales bacterium]MDX2512256.1 hypothetical protein [Desulfobacterales bacterium]